MLLSLAGVIGAQAPSGRAPCSSTDGTKSADGKPCSPPKSVSEQFPFPGEQPEAKAPASPAQAPGDASQGSKSVKDQFPYPGETPDLPAAGSAKANKGAANAGFDGESSSSSSADAPPDGDGKPALKDEGTEGTTARGRRRLRPPAQKILSDDERVEEDLSVAHFYQQAGNLTGAYLRTKDAVKIQPQAADAHLALAEVAQKLGKKDEAIAEYTKYLELDPDGDGAKAAKKGLERLKP
jgi:tetratricopeptide (TPR) repeat protein